MSEDARLQAPVSLVTGANKGIGFETVRRLREAGHLEFLAARNPDLGRAAAATAGARFVRLGMTAIDLTRGQGHSVTDGTDAILAFALAGPGSPTGTYADREGDLPW